MRLLLADDHDLLRDTLVMFLSREPDISAVISVKDLTAALEAMQTKGPFDLVLLDFGMPGMAGLEGLKTALARAKGQRIALISGIATREVAKAALAMGAAGFLPKTLPAKALADAVRMMARGRRFAPLDLMPDHRPNPTQHPIAERLSKREMQVLEGICAGKANKEIARTLGLMEPTVKLHVKTLYRKIGAANRTQAAMIAKEAGIF